jgi:hypothetical protein
VPQHHERVTACTDRIVVPSPAEPFLDGRELNLSAGRRIGGRLSEIFPQPPETGPGSPAAQPPSTAGGHPTPTRSLAAFVVGLGADCAAAVRLAADNCQVYDG